MEPTSSKEQVAPSDFNLQLGNMQVIVLVLLGLIILTSKSAGVLAVAMLAIIIHNSKHAVDSSKAITSDKSMPVGNEEIGSRSINSGKAAKEPKKSDQVCTDANYP